MDLDVSGGMRRWREKFSGLRVCRRGRRYACWSCHFFEDVLPRCLFTGVERISKRLISKKIEVSPEVDERSEMFEMGECNKSYDDLVSLSTQ